MSILFLVLIAFLFSAAIILGMGLTKPKKKKDIMDAEDENTAKDDDTKEG